MEGRTSSVSDRLNIYRQPRGGGATSLVGRGGLKMKTNTPSAGGKGRSSNGDDDPESTTGSFDPMGDDYRNENINSYDSGPGADLPISDQVNNSMRTSETTRLYVKNVDKTLNNTGLLNIFSKYGKVTDCYVHPVNVQFETKTAIVQFEKLQDARRAKEELHFKPPLNLIVKFAQTRDNTKSSPQKGPVNDNRVSNNKENASRNEDKTSYNGHKRNTDNFRTNNGSARTVNGATTTARYDSNGDGRRSKSYGNQSNDLPSHRQNYTSGKFNAPDDSPEVEINNKLFGPESTTYEGNKRASLGHTVYIPRSKPPNSSKPSVNGASQDCNGEYFEGRILSCPYKYGSCKKCGGTATNVCSWCKEFYCSQNCYQGDSSSHKSCPRRDIKFESDGRVMFIDVPEEKPVESSGRARNEIDQNNSRPNFNRPTSNRNENFAKNVHVVKEERSPPKPVKTEPERVMKKPVKKPKPEKVPLPLPENTFTPVTIVYMDDVAYYGMETRRSEELQELICTLQECAAKEPTLKNPKVGDMCASIFDDAWYRCRISELKGSTAVVRYVDFGNDEKVEVSALKALRSDLAAVPDLAIAIKINKQSKVPLAEGNDIKIKPIRMLKDNQLIAQIEDDPAPLPEPEPEPSDTEVEETVPDEVPATKSNGPKNESLTSEPALKITNDEVDGKDAAKSAVYEKCVIVYKEGPSTFWVTKCVEDIYKVSSDIGAHCKKALPLNSLKVNRIYGHLYDGVWCRAQVLSMKPLDVFFVDFGNADKLGSNAELFELPADLENLNRLAFKIELEEGYPESYLQKVEDDEIEFTVIRMLNDETSFVRVIDSQKKNVPILNKLLNEERSTPSPSIVEDKNLLPVKRKKNRTLYASKKCSSVTVEITHVLGSDCLSGTLISDTPEYVSNQEISARLAKFKFVKEDVSLGADVTARVGSLLHRGYVMKKDVNVFHVALVDFGRIVSVTEVAPLPQELKNVFENSVRVVFDKPMTDVDHIKLIGKRMSFTRIDSGTDCIKAHSDQYGDVVIQPWECMVEEMELDAFELTSGSEVIITAASSPASVYLQSLDSMEKLDVLIQDLASHCMKEKPMTRKPLCNELVACKFELDQKYYRAKIMDKSKDKYKVAFVDYGNVENDIPLSDFKRLTDDFKCIPCCAVKVGLKRVPGPKFNSVAMKIINDFSVHETIFTASFVEKDLGSVELKNKETGLSLNEKLAEAMKPSWVNNPDSSLMVNPYMVCDLKFEPWPRSQPLTIGVVSVKSYNEVTCILAEETPAKVFVMSDSFTQRMTSYAETVSKYVPRKQEMCLAIFDGQWYRAVCLDQISNDFLVFFVDYGNTCTVSHDELRKMPPEFMEPPAYVKHCDLMIFADDGKLTKENKELLMSKMESELMTNCYVIDECADKAVLWTDYFNDTLEKLGLPLKEQPPI